MTTLATTDPSPATPTGLVDTIVTVTGLTPDALAWLVFAAGVLAFGAYASREIPRVLATASDLESANSRQAREAEEARS